MALSTLRLRRALSLSSHLLKHRPVSTIASSKPYISSSSSASSFSSSSNFRNPKNLLQVPTHSLVPSASFRSSALVLNSSRYNDDDDKISPDTILFEGCDYNHWLITMDFPKDPKPTPEEMVETYVQTCAKGLGISIEEAKQKMYACSTTTYQGFQAVMTEEESEKFRGLPGVVFILPDSYIDPVNKEYGGDKYINGTIIPRPPPVQYSRTSGRNRDNRPRYDRQQRDPMPMQQRTPPYDRQSSMPHQNFGPPGQSDGRGYSPPGGRDFLQGERRDPMPMGGRDERAPIPMQQMNTPLDHQSSPPQQSYGQYGQSDGRGYGPQGGRDFPQGERRDPMPMGGRGYTPGGYQGQSTYNQGDQRNYAPQERRDLRGDFREQGTVPSGDYRPAGSSGYGQSYAGTGDRQRGVGGDYRQTGGSGYGQGYAGPGDDQRFGGDNRGSGYGGPGEGQRFSPVDQDNGIQSEQRNFNPVGQTGTGQGRY